MLFEDVFFMENPQIFRKPQGLQIRSYVTLHRRTICESAWCLHDTWISKSSSSLSNPSENLSKSGKIVKSMGSLGKLGKFESPSSYPKFPKNTWLKNTHRMNHVFLGRWLPRSFCCPCQGEILNFLQSDSGIWGCFRSNQAHRQNPFVNLRELH